jgi:NAD(P)-dependent dehydrogenase (short-subunit alcohol dehydrogenase family)
MDLGLKGRVAAITGASKGIGKAIARGFASEGADVVLMARGKELLEQTADHIRQETGVRALAVSTDITSLDSLKAAAAAAADRFGTVNILVNNAGAPIRRPDRQIGWSDAEWEGDVNIKTIGMLRAIQTFLPHLARDGSGRIINISGVAGMSVMVPAMTHGINNAAMNHVTTYLAHDLAAEQITVNAVVPGIIATEWRDTWAANMAKQQAKTPEEFLADYCRKMGIVAGRLGTMDEVRDLVLFLASDRARYINGSRITIDGGYTINAR